MRKIIATCAAIVALSVAACSTTGGTLTFSVVQNEARAVDAGIDSAFALAKTSAAVPKALITELTPVVAGLDSTTATLESLTATSSTNQIVEAFIGDVDSVVTLLPIDPNTKTAIQLAITIFEAFDAGSTTLPASVVLSEPAMGATLGGPVVVIPTPTVVPAK